MNRRRIGLIVVLLAATCTFAPPTYFTAPIVYFGAPIHGRVVDGETQKPLAGAVVAVEWEIVGDWGRRDPLVAREVLTDENGNFEIPGWGPRFRSPIGGVLEYDPMIWVFKTAYGHHLSQNRMASNAFIRRSDRNGEVIALRPGRLAPDVRARDLSHVLRAGPGQPLLLRELAKERERIPASVKTTFFLNLWQRMKKRGVAP